MEIQINKYYRSIHATQIVFKLEEESLYKGYFVRVYGVLYVNNKMQGKRSYFKDHFINSFEPLSEFDLVLYFDKEEL